MVDTKKVAGRRSLRFETLAAAVEEAERLVAADAEGRVERLGNWTLGQAVGHVAFWAAAPFDGYPELPPLPWFAKLMMKLGKGRMLKKGMPAGVRIPGAEGGTLGTEDLPPADALAKLKSAFERLAGQGPAEPNPLFGVMTHEEWTKLNLRHAELHFGFFRTK